MKQVHGTFHSFKELGAAMRIKSKDKKDPTCKCKNCGGRMTKVANNVWVCGFNKLEDEKLPNGTEVQVFSKCDNVVIASV